MHVRSMNSLPWDAERMTEIWMLDYTEGPLRIPVDLDQMYASDVKPWGGHVSRQWTTLSEQILSQLCCLFFIVQDKGLNLPRSNFWLTRNEFELDRDKEWSRVWDVRFDSGAFLSWLRHGPSVSSKNEAASEGLQVSLELYWLNTST